VPDFVRWITANWQAEKTLPNATIVGASGGGRQEMKRPGRIEATGPQVFFVFSNGDARRVQ
jgi:hypothetical protein